jgi:hypothetical protein
LRRFAFVENCSFSNFKLLLGGLVFKGNCSRFKKHCIWSEVLVAFEKLLFFVRFLF